MISVKSKVTEGQVNSDSLSKGKEKIITWIICIINPIWGGAILYYGWKKKLPTKAKQANKISMIAFLIELVLVFGINLALLTSH